MDKKQYNEAFSPEEIRRIEDEARSHPEVVALREPLNEMLYLFAHRILPAVSTGDGAGKIWVFGDAFLNSMPDAAWQTSKKFTGHDIARPSDIKCGFVQVGGSKGILVEYPTPVCATLPYFSLIVKGEPNRYFILEKERGKKDAVLCEWCRDKKDAEGCVHDNFGVTTPAPTRKWFLDEVAEVLAGNRRALMQSRPGRSIGLVS
jgi:hypothetical protein